MVTPQAAVKWPMWSEEVVKVRLIGNTGAPAPPCPSSSTETSSSTSGTARYGFRPR